MTELTADRGALPNVSGEAAGVQTSFHGALDYVRGERGQPRG